MSLTLPPVGTSHLLDLVSPYAPDDFIATVCPRHFTGGRRHALSAPQLWRTHLLAVLTSTHSLNLLVTQLPEQAAWRRFARLRATLPTARMLHEFRQTVGLGGLRAINQHLVGRLLRRTGLQPHAVALMDATDLPAACSGFKKNSGDYTAAHAALGGRTLKTGQSRWFVGYKKHTLRLWLPTVHPSVTLVPLVSWLTPGNVAEGGLLRPSLYWCRRHLGWWPGIVVADMGYLSAPDKQAVRTGGQCAVVTKLRADMKLVPPYVSAAQVECPQGQRLEWWEYDLVNGQQWFRVPAEPELCAHCWEASSCPRHFGYAVGQHETLLGLLPLASRVAQRLLRQVRPWIEPAQSFEKNQLGLGQMFFNSLRLTWQMSFWTDSAVLLRTMVWLDTPPETSLLASLQPSQLEFELPAEK